MNEWLKNEPKNTLHPMIIEKIEKRKSWSAKNQHVFASMYAFVCVLSKYHIENELLLPKHERWILCGPSQSAF